MFLIFLILVTKMVNIDRYDSQKQMYFAVLNGFKNIKGFWNQKDWGQPALDQLKITIWGWV